MRGPCLFVYGTLRRGAAHPLSRRLARAAIYRGTAYLQGRLYDLGRYPGAVSCSSCGIRVKGDLYVLRSARILDVLDAYEGCRSGDRRPHEFVRERVSVTRADGRMVEAWAYLYARAPKGRRIQSGDWLDHHPMMSSTVSTTSTIPR